MHIFTTANNRIQLNANKANVLRDNNDELINIGANNQPVYFENGKPVSISYTVESSVPEDAAFTDTKVTSADNHYSPTANSTYALNADASGGSAAIWGTTQLVTGVNLTRDSKGHVTGLSVDSIKMPTNPDTNTTYTFATGGSNGTFSVTPKNGTAQNISIKGLGTAAYTNSSAYAPASHTQSASTITGLANVATSGSYNDLSDKPSTYSLPNATSSTIGGVKVGNNITVSNGTISLTKANVTTALGYTPPTSDNDTKNTAGSSNSSSTLYLIGATSQSSTGVTTYSNSSVTMTNGSLTASSVYGAVWNDYAEYRTQTEDIKPGYCVASTNDGKVYKTIEKFQPCDGIVSDTFGFAIGETKENKTPLAVAGRVLAYCEGDRNDYHSGDTVGAGPGGKVIKMTREDIQKWPDRIVGIVSEIPQYETWGTGNVLVDGRIWIKIK